MSPPPAVGALAPNGSEVDHGRLEAELHQAVQRAEASKRRMAEANEALQQIVQQSQTRLAEMVRLHELEVVRIREQARREIDETMAEAARSVSEIERRAQALRTAAPAPLPPPQGWSS